MRRSKTSKQLFASILVRFTCVTTFSFTAAYAGETVVFRSGTVNGQIGQIPTVDHVGPVDDHVTYLTTPWCNTPLRANAFTAVDFADASAGPFAELVVPHDFWTDELPSDPAARWISWNHGAIGPPTGPSSGSARPPQSVLYAVDFEIATPGTTTGTIELWFAADDRLGDEPGTGSNPIGAYLNGEPLDPGFGSGHFAFETYVVQNDVGLRTGTNTLYLYQRDDGCHVSGIVFSCRVTTGFTAGYCTSTPNSTGLPARIAMRGVPSIALNDCRLEAVDMPGGDFGVFFYGQGRFEMPMGNGYLCISPFHPGLVRLMPPFVVDSQGRAEYAIDFPTLPVDGPITAGSTWCFQASYRDLAAGGAGYDLTDAVEVTFFP